MGLKVVLLGATGMVGQGVLRECLLDARVDSVLTLGRTATGQRDEKLREIVQPDLFDLSSLDGELAGFDACFFCLGISSFRMKEEAYRRVTYDLTLAVARTLLQLNPAMVFEYISGVGTDSTERGASMWARVKGRTENDLLRLGFKAAYMLRPGGILPLHGIKSKTTLYQMLYSLLGPVLPAMQRTFPAYITTTEELGHAMIGLAASGSESRVIENKELRSVQ